MSPTSAKEIKELKVFLRKYPVGKKTACFVNPKSPQESVILRQWGHPLYPLLAGFLGIMICFSAYWIFIMIRCLIRGPGESAASAKADSVKKDSYHNNYADDDDWK